MLTKDFLAALFPCPGFIETRAIRGEEVMRDFAAGVRCALAFFYKTKDAFNLYFGVAARASRADGSKHNLAYAAALWVDIDAADAERRLEASSLPQSSMVVASGTPGHRQAYWLLKAPCRLDAPDAVARFESYLRGIAEASGGDRACVDASRLLRLPNSRNFKHQPPPYVDVLAWHPQRRYRLDDLPQGDVVVPARCVTGDAVEPNRRVETGWLLAILEHGYEGQWNPDESAVDYKVACRLLDDGFPPEEALWLCTHSPAIGQRKRDPLSYWRRTVAKAASRHNRGNQK
jgi:hypothetical protein